MSLFLHLSVFMGFYTVFFVFNVYIVCFCVCLYVIRACDLDIRLRPVHAAAWTSLFRNSSGVTLVKHMFPPKLPLSLRGSSHPHVTHCSSGQAHSSSQTASRSIQLFLYGSQMLCCTLHCQWGRKPPKLLLPLGTS